MVAEYGHHCVMAVKTAHARFPQKYLNEKMKDFPGGTWIVLEGTCGRTGQKLVAIGYKYNSKKVLHFVTTHGAGSTTKGKPYKMKYNDQYGNVCYRDVPRPAIISRNFEHSNCVDVHNQMRQSHLALEECWVTTNGWFRIFTTLIGMTVTDLWFLRESHNKTKDAADFEKESGTRKRKIVAFAGDLSESLLDMSERLEAEEKGNDNETEQQNILCREVGGARGSPTSSLTSCSNERRHERVFLTYKISKSAATRGKKIPVQARCMWCSRTEGKTCKTQLKCRQCGFGFCAERSGRKCWRLHVINDGPPEKKVTKPSKKRSRTNNVVSMP